MKGVNIFYLSQETMREAVASYFDLNMAAHSSANYVADVSEDEGAEEGFFRIEIRERGGDDLSNFKEHK